MKTITISGIIGWDATPEALREDLKAAAGADVEIIISSPGGFVGEGLEMFNLIRNYPGHTTARLSGYAMSMASYIPLAAKKIVAEDNAIYMIHNARGMVWGDHNDILRYGETTRGMSRLIARAYAKRTGKEPEEIEKMMDVETYFFGQDMVDHGFVDELIETGDDADKASAIAFALAAHQNCMAKMAADQQAVKNDLVRMAAVCGAADPRQPAKPAHPNAGGMIMTLEQLKSDHPALVAALVAEAQAGMITEEAHQAALATARTEGAIAEVQRITEVRAQTVVGHEALIEQMAFDGKSTGADAALAIVAAEQRRTQQAAADLDADANAAAAHANGDGNGQKTMKINEFKAMSQTDQRAFVKGGGKVID